eukprot:4968091-Pyramimonas_sp.AAC.3
MGPSNAFKGPLNAFEGPCMLSGDLWRASGRFQAPQEASGGHGKHLETYGGVARRRRGRRRRAVVAPRSLDRAEGGGAGGPPMGGPPGRAGAPAAKGTGPLPPAERGNAAASVHQEGMRNIAGGTEGTSGPFRTQNVPYFNVLTV